ncbi:hypothetical protein FQR65_LT01971 [Abscondita terminalis]|nr:hypothetical protein FQR65_LT01971 [Abscondita terminalis]
MNNPELFLKYKQFGINGSEKMLEKHINLLVQNHEHPVTLVDIGSGPGNISNDVLLPLFKIPVDKVIGFDVSEKMVNFANATYGNEILSFKHVDVGGKAPEEFNSYFDFVFSFWTLQWFRDQRKLYTNINKIMKPNGQMFVTYIARGKQYDVYQSVWRKPEYSPYITDFNLGQSVFQKSKDPKAELKLILEETGFEVGLIEIETLVFDNLTLDSVKVTIVDIGCGPGNITHDGLFPLFKTPVSKVIGLDVSQEMVDFANAKYGSNIFSFQNINLDHVVPEEFISCFDFAFSFWTLQWFRDQRKLYANLHKILKPNGQIFVTYVARSKLFEIYQSVWKKPEYSPYITDFELGQSVFQSSNDPQSELKVILEESGFEVRMLKIETTGFANFTALQVKEHITPFNPVYVNIPSHLKDQFIIDHVNEVDRTEIDVPDNYYMNVEIFVVCAKKSK